MAPEPQTKAASLEHCFTLDSFLPVPQSISYKERLCFCEKTIWEHRQMVKKSFQSPGLYWNAVTLRWMLGGRYTRRHNQLKHILESGFKWKDICSLLSLTLLIYGITRAERNQKLLLSHFGEKEVDISFIILKLKRQWDHSCCFFCFLTKKWFQLFQYWKNMIEIYTVGSKEVEKIESISLTRQRWKQRSNFWKIDLQF